MSGGAELYRLPAVGRAERAASAALTLQMQELREHVRADRPWLPAVRWSNAVRIIQGTNVLDRVVPPWSSVAALLDDVAPVGADPSMRARVIAAYAQAHGRVVELSASPEEVDEQVLCSLHGTIARDEVRSRPGTWRTAPVAVRNEGTGEVAYTAAPPGDVVPLVRHLLASTSDQEEDEQYVATSLALFNFIRIHPFSDANGRTGRALHTLLVARTSGLPPELVSIEEYLGAHMRLYDPVMIRTGGPAWGPWRDPRVWVQFCLAAHLIQGETNLRRLIEADRLWASLPGSAADRSGLFGATLGRALRPEAIVDREVISDGWLVQGDGGRLVASTRLAACAAPFLQIGFPRPDVPLRWTASPRVHGRVAE